MIGLAHVLDPQALVLSALAAAFAAGVLREDPERWHWRAYLWTVIAVNVFFGVFGPWGYLFGVIGALVVPYVYFITFQNRQYTLRDMFFFVLLIAALGTQIPSALTRA